MTTTYDPSSSSYYSEEDLRAEMTRVFDICHGCRLCFNLCPAFPLLFEFIDAKEGSSTRLSPKEQDSVVEACYQCKLCYLKCPYVPPHEWELDFPRLMMRANAFNRRAGRGHVPDRISDRVLARTDLMGKVGTTIPGLVNSLIEKPGSFARKAMQATAGIASERLLPPYAKERFSTWFKLRQAALMPEKKGEVTLFGTCFVEYMEPSIGKDVVKVYEHNGIACQLAERTRCCGAPLLHGGDVPAFESVARKNVDALLGHVRAGRKVVVSQPTCGYVLKEDYPRYLRTEDAKEVAVAVRDVCEYLVDFARCDPNALRQPPRDEEGKVTPEKVVYHASCHMRAQSMGFKARDLLRMAGIQVETISECSGIDGTWGYHARHYQEAKKVIGKLKTQLAKVPDLPVCGDCFLADTAIHEETARKAVHPLSILARAYGIPEEPPTQAPHSVATSTGGVS